VPFSHDIHSLFWPWNMWTFSFDELNYQATKSMLIFASSTSFITFSTERVSIITSACLLFVYWSLSIV
jgi:hypothetical protein